MRNKNKLYLTISIVSFLIVLLALLAIGGLLFSYKQARDNYAQLAKAARAESPAMQTEPASSAETAEPDAEQTLPVIQPALVDIPINFVFLQEENPDIIGWIIVDGTVIDYPILYDNTYNFYYLKHNYAGTATGSGSIFVLSENANDFSDFNTVVYGHNLLNGQMFAQLHKFRDKTFFDSHGQIVIYTPDEKLTYQVFAAYRTDNLDIIANNDFSSEELREQYIESIYTHADFALFKPEYQVTASDKIVTLSTCIGNPAYRFVVQGVLVSDEMGEFAEAQGPSEDLSES